MMPLQSISPSRLESAAKTAIVAGALATGLSCMYPLFYAPQPHTEDSRPQSAMTPALFPVTHSHASEGSLESRLPKATAPALTREHQYNSNYFLLGLLLSYGVFAAGTATYLTMRFTPIKEKSDTSTQNP